MSFSIQSSMHHLNALSQKASLAKSAFNDLEKEQKLIHELFNALQEDLNEGVQTFNWELNTQKRALLDEIYDLELLGKETARKYAFNTTDEVMDFMQKVRASLEEKSNSLQEASHLHEKEKNQLMEAYHLLLEVISKFTQSLVSLAQRV